MKSTTRMIGAWNGWDTRRQNQLRLKAFDYFRQQALVLERGLPVISCAKEPNIHHSKAGWYLSIDLGNGYRQFRFESCSKLGDFLINLAPHCR